MTTGRRALITGASGFIGSALSRELDKAGWQVSYIVRSARQEKSSNAAIAGTRLVHDGTMKSMSHIVHHARPDIIFHLAALFLVDHRPENIEELVRSNVLLGTQLLEAASTQGIKGVVNAGTAWQHYGNEDYNPVNLYAATKQAFQDILEYYVQARRLRAVTLKIFDSYGPKDDRPKIWKALRLARSASAPLHFSGGEQKLDPVYISDIIAAFLSAGNRLLSGKTHGHEIYSLSSGKPRTLREIINLYAKVSKKKIPVSWGAKPYREREVMTPWSRGRRLPGWRPKISLEKGFLLSEGLSSA